MTIAQGRLVDQILTASLITRNDSYAADRAIPTVYVQKDKVEIPIWGSEHLEVDAIGSKHAPGTLFQAFSPTLTTSSTQLVEYGEELVFPQEFNQVLDQNVAIGQEYALALQDRMLTLNEYLGSSVLSTVANYGGQHTPTTKWDAANSTAITDIRKAIDGVVNLSGKYPTKIVFSYNAWTKFLMSAEMLSWRNVNSFGLPTEQVIAAYFGVNEVIIANTKYMSGTTLTDMYDEFCAVIYQPQTPGQFTQAWAYKFVQQQYPVIERYVDDMRRSTILRYVTYFKYAVTNVKCGYIIQNVLT